MTGAAAAVDTEEDDLVLDGVAGGAVEAGCAVDPLPCGVTSRPCTIRNRQEFFCVVGRTQLLQTLQSQALWGAQGVAVVRT